MDRKGPGKIEHTDIVPTALHKDLTSGSFRVFSIHWNRKSRLKGLYFSSITKVITGLDMRNLQYEIRICQKPIIKSQWSIW